MYFCVPFRCSAFCYNNFSQLTMCFFGWTSFIRLSFFLCYLLISTNRVKMLTCMCANVFGLFVCWRLFVAHFAHMLNNSSFFLLFFPFFFEIVKIYDVHVCGMWVTFAGIEFLREISIDPIFFLHFLGWSFHTFIISFVCFGWCFRFEKFSIDPTGYLLSNNFPYRAVNKNRNNLT